MSESGNNSNFNKKTYYASSLRASAASTETASAPLYDAFGDASEDSQRAVDPWLT